MKNNTTAATLAKKKITDANKAIRQEAILAGLIEKGTSLRKLCAQPDAPDMATVMRWLHADEAFREQYARAKATGIERLADEIIEIADDSSRDYLPADGEDGPPALNAEAIRRSALRVDARKWLLSKLVPKKYGDKLGIGQADDLGPLTVVVRQFGSAKKDGP